MKNSNRKSNYSPITARTRSRRTMDGFKTEIKKSPGRKGQKREFLKSTAPHLSRKSRSRSPKKEDKIEAVSNIHLKFKTKTRGQRNLPKGELDLVNQIEKKSNKDEDNATNQDSPLNGQSLSSKFSTINKEDSIE